MEIKFNAKKLEKQIREAAAKELKKGVEISCPKCSHKTKVSTAKANSCPNCGTALQLDY